MGGGLGKRSFLKLVCNIAYLVDGPVDKSRWFFLSSSIIQMLIIPCLACKISSITPFTINIFRYVVVLTTTASTNSPKILYDMGLKPQENHKLCSKVSALLSMNGLVQCHLNLFTPLKILLLRRIFPLLLSDLARPNCSSTSCALQPKKGRIGHNTGWLVVDRNGMALSHCDALHL